MPQRRQAPRWCFWRGNILWCRFEVNGWEYRESLRTSSIEVARKRAQEIRTRAVAAVRFGEIEHTWEDAVADWAVLIVDAIGPRTALRYEQSLQAVGKHFAGRLIKEIDARSINVMVAARQKEGVTNATVRRDLTAVSSVLDHAVDQEWREGNPAREKSRRIKEKKHVFVLPSLENIEAVLKPMTGGIKDLARFAWITGMRLSEITALDRRQISGTLVHFRGKGGKGRTIELSNQALAIVRRQPISRNSSLVFHHDGVGYSNVSSNFSRAVRQARKLAQKESRDFTYFTFHGLRHVFAIESLRSGHLGLYELSRHLGHGSVQVTENTYLEYLTPEQVKDARDGTKAGTRAMVFAGSTSDNSIESL